MLKIKHDIADGVWVLTLEGKLAGLEGRNVVQDKLKSLKKETKSKGEHVVLDLGRVSWVDSTGLGELIAALSSVNKNGGKLVLANIPGPVQSLLNMTNLSEVFEVYDDLEEAVAKLKGS